MIAPHLLVALGTAIVVWAAAASLSRFVIPTPVVLVVAGVVIGFLPFVPDASLSPNAVLLGLLPLLVFYAALSSSPGALAKQAPQIGALAIGLVLITAGVVAVVGHELGRLSWPMAFVLGTAVGPTDAVAATSIAGKVGVAEHLSATLQGEALFNDATALVLYVAAVAAATSGHFSLGHTVLSVVYGSIVGVAIGLGVGIASSHLRRRIDDPPIEIVLSLLIAYAAYLPAQALGASGVLAAVSAGLYLGWHNSTSLSARTRLQSTAFWDTLVFLLDAALFILVGLTLHTFNAASREPVLRLSLTGVCVVGAVIVIRLLWVGIVVSGVGPLRRLRGTIHERRERAVLGWSGMRGAVTLAAVLAVPAVRKNGTLLAGRDDVIYLAFGVILVTLVGQGLTLPIVARFARSREDPAAVETEREARLELLHAALGHLDDEVGSRSLPDEVTGALRVQYEARIRRLGASGEDAVSDQRVRQEEHGLRRELLRVERRRLLELRDQRRISTTTLRDIERDLDLMEATLR